MNAAILPTLAALFGAAIGGFSSLLASWILRRAQIKAEWLAQEIGTRQNIYREFIELASRCYADALQHDELDIADIVDLHAKIGRMRVHSSAKVLASAGAIRQTILDAYLDRNRTPIELRELLASGSIDLLSGFSEECRIELEALRRSGL